MNDLRDSSVILLILKTVSTTNLLAQNSKLENNASDNVNDFVTRVANKKRRLHSSRRLSWSSRMGWQVVLTTIFEWLLNLQLKMWTNYCVVAADNLRRFFPSHSIRSKSLSVSSTNPSAQNSKLENNASDNPYHQQTCWRKIQNCKITPRIILLFVGLKKCVKRPQKKGSQRK